jgi:hypothetical protein
LFSRFMVYALYILADILYPWAACSATSSLLLDRLCTIVYRYIEPKCLKPWMCLSPLPHSPLKHLCFIIFYRQRHFFPSSRQDHELYLDKISVERGEGGSSLYKLAGYTLQRNFFQRTTPTSPL